jgi:eukaryotic-like serine/threonine-protein kinase
VGSPEASSGLSTTDTPTIADGAAAVARSGRQGDGRPGEGPSSEVSSNASDQARRTAREILHGEEIARTRVFVVVAGVFSISLALLLNVLGGDPVARRALLGALAAVVAACAWFGWELRRDQGFTLARANAFTHVCLVATYVGIWYFGVYSPAVGILAFGLAFWSMGQSGVFGAYASAGGAYALLSAATVAGAMPDRGLVPSRALTTPQQISLAVLVEGVLFATYLLGRRGREVSVTALEQHDRDVRAIAQRDALLREARHELAQVTRKGGIGQWTEQVVGGFRLGRVLGRGAMGEVYEATRLRDGRPAAIKLLLPHVLAQPAFIQRFVREAKVVASLDAANVVRVLDVSPPDAPLPYLAMERLVGRDLSELLRERKRLGVRGVLAMLRQVGAGLDAVRASGVVHRDLKPRNLFLAQDAGAEAWKILDFGVARQVGEETITQDQIVGTPNYMAPEQADGRGVTYKTDLFSLGVIAYRALTGHPAFEGETTAEILYKVVHTMPLRPSAAAPLDPQLDLALAVAMAKDPADRFASASELAAALEGAARGSLDGAIRGRGESLLAKLPWAQVPD